MNWWEKSYKNKLSETWPVVRQLETKEVQRMLEELAEQHARDEVMRKKFLKETTWSGSKIGLRYFNQAVSVPPETHISKAVGLTPQSRVEINLVAGPFKNPVGFMVEGTGRMIADLFFDDEDECFAVIVCGKKQSKTIFHQHGGWIHLLVTENFD